MPDRPAPIPDLVLRILVRENAPAPSGWTETLGDLARELLACREVLREHWRVASMPSDDFVAYAADTIGTERSLVVRTRALLPEHTEAPDA